MYDRATAGYRAHCKATETPEKRAQCGYWSRNGYCDKEVYVRLIGVRLLGKVFSRSCNGEEEVETNDHLQLGN